MIGHADVLFGVKGANDGAAIIIASIGKYAIADANARLIAAAPDLLVALKMLMKAYESVLPGLAHIAVQDYALVNDAPVAAERAIIKAEQGS